ncbi:acyltransferase [Vibrio furnissii]|uniref:acyltransferase n=1 Tax=Vibrio furnissii TaxID=29494 RepID=UPI003750C0E4
MTKRIIFFDMLRCVAAVAVIGIHVLAPYRQELGTIPLSEWLTAVTVNGLSRWAVPVFILISGALMLSDPRPFDLQYYLRRRLGKVLVPFMIWSLFYAYLSGWSASGFDGQLALETLKHSPQHETYYHLGFFYYFIPLYFVIPLFQWLVKRVDTLAICAWVAVWMLTATLFLFYIDGVWNLELWLYSGYLLLGYLLYQKVPNNRWVVMAALLLGGGALYVTVTSVVSVSLQYQSYIVERWLSYKTLNTILAASMVFILCRAWADHLSSRAQTVVAFISQHSLGIYLLHPIFLWPMKAYGWHQGHPGWVIPMWIVLSGAASLGVSWLVSRSAKTRWLLP